MATTKRARSTPRKKTATAAAGWRPPERWQDTYLLKFTDPEFEGLEVRVRRMSFGGLRATAGITTVDRQRLIQGQLEQGDIAKLDAVLTEIGEALVSWNVLDHNGNPVPCTTEALDRQDLVFALTLLDAWMGGVAQEQLPKPKDLSELPMENLG